MLVSAAAGVYSDELITASELNRQTDRVLDVALERPVTITRNDRHFALLRREEMAFWIEAATISKTVFELMNVTHRLRLGEKIDPDHLYGWLHVFDTDELSELSAELENAYHQVGTDSGAVDRLDALIHEWHESARAIQSHELAEAFRDELDEVLLTQPTVLAPH